MRAAVAAALALAACAQPVDEPPLGDYTTWKRIDITGNAPGHINSYRIVYVNAVAATAPRDLATIYPVGSIIVKEVYDLSAADQPGALRHTAIMRKKLQPDPVLAEEAGWLYTEAAAGEDEAYYSLCWNRCHVAAPYLGAWYDYRD